MECTSSQIYHLWLLNNQEKWRLSQNASESAKMLLERECAKSDDVEIIPISEEAGMFSLAFALKKPLEVIGERVEEIALDGTCE